MNLSEEHRRERIRLRAVRATGLANARGSTMLDALARVARRTLRAHAAYVTLVDETEQFAPGCASGDGDEPARAVPLERSICRHLVGKTSALVIADTTASPLTRDGVEALGVGAYLGVPLTDSQGNTLGALCAVERAARAWSDEDVGALSELASAARTELARAEREQRFALAIEATAEVVYSHDLVEDHFWRQGALGRIFGQSDDELPETREAWVTAIDPRDRAATLRSLEEAVGAKKLRWEGEYRILHRDGHEVTVRDRARVTYDAEGTPLRLVGTVQDITPERAITDELRANDARFRTVLGALREGVVLQDRTDAIRLANPAARRILGLDALEGHSSYDPWDAITAEGEPFRPEEHPSVVAFRTNLPQHDVEMGIRRHDGERIWLSIDALPILLPGEEVPSSVVATFREVTAQRKAASAAAELAAIVSSSTLPIVSSTRDGVVRSWNRAAENMFGRSAAEMIGAPLARLTPPELAERDEALVARAFAGEPVEDVETLRLRADGSVVAVRLTVSPIVDEAGRVLGLSTMFRDVSRAQLLEAELRQAQKLEAMGRLTGGVAHDFNNLLTVIHANAELLRTDLAEGSPATEDVDEIVRTVTRATALTRQLLAFGRKQVVAPCDLPLDEVVGATTSMLRRLLGSAIHLETQLDPSRPVVRADRGQLEQVLVNFAVNARDAMPSGGTLRIATRAGAAGERPAGAPTSPLFEAPFVVLTVSDTGTGMDERTLAHAFEPFFTTKEEGRGTGLGLSTVHGIVTQSNGTVWITSELGAGTTVWVALPRSAAATRVEKEHKSDPTHARTRRRILVVDEDRGVLVSISRLLERRGYEVFSCPSAEDAVELSASERARGKPIDAVVTEGMDLVARLREPQPDLPVVVMSSEDERPALVDPRLRVLEKPLVPDQLVEALERLTRR